MAILILLGFFILAWVVLILPRQRELKRHQKLMVELVPGEEVMMTSGIYGVIRSIDGDYVRLEIADGVEVKIAKRSVAARVEPVDSAGDEDFGQTPVSEIERPSTAGVDGDEAVTDVDHEVDPTNENEA